jgi:hypothetical protein
LAIINKRSFTKFGKKLKRQVKKKGIMLYFRNMLQLMLLTFCLSLMIPKINSSNFDDFGPLKNKKTFA